MPDGLLVKAADRVLASTVTGDVATGATDLPVEWPGRFPDTGGTVRIQGTDYRYSTVDEDADTITLLDPTTVDLLAGDPVELVNNAAVMADRDAFILVEGADQPIVVDVPHALLAFVPVGDETGPYLEPWPVTIDATYSELVNVLSRPAIIDGSSIDPITLPDRMPTDAPEVSPTPVMRGAIGGITVNVPEVAGEQVSVDVWVSDTSPVDVNGPPTVTFTGNGPHLAFVRDLDGTPLEVGTTYHGVDVARNAAGAAAASAEASTAPAQVTHEDLAVNAITADNVVTNSLTAETLAAVIVLVDQMFKVGRITISDEGGIVIPQTGGSSTIFRSDGSGNDLAGAAMLTANLDADRTATNRPPLMIGPRAGIHLRVDGNEILAMDGPTGIGNLFLNAGGPVVVGGGKGIGAMSFGTIVNTPLDSLGTSGPVPHGLGRAPTTVVVGPGGGNSTTIPVQAFDYTATTFRVRFRELVEDGGQLSKGAGGCEWIAVA